MDFEKNIELIESKLGYTFRDKSLLRQAFTRSSYCNEHRGKGGVKYMSNEVLEFFGDSVLSTVIIGLLLEEKTERYEYGIRTELGEGDFSVIRSNLSDKRNLSVSMAELGLQRFLIMSKGDEQEGIADEPSVMEDLFESIVGAVYIDSGKDMRVATALVRGMLDLSSYSKSEGAPVQNAKGQLQEWCADKKHRLPVPKYITVSESGPDHKKVYERGCYIGDELVATGCGKNTKIADAAAAAAALEVLKARKTEREPVPQEGVSQLKAYAASKKLPTPEFRDLGESSRSTEQAKEFVIECRLGGRCSSATAPSKQEARAIAAGKLLAELKAADAPAKHPPKKKNPPKPVEEKKSAKPKKETAARTSPSPKRTPHYHKKRS